MVSKTKKPAPPDDALMDSHVATKKFKFKGHVFFPGEPISYGVYRHLRFESLIRAGLVKAV